MQISERAALALAIFEGGYHIYPAGKLIELIKKQLSGDRLEGDFDNKATVDKVKQAFASLMGTNEILDKDFSLLCSRLQTINGFCNVEEEINHIAAKLPLLAKKYFGLAEFSDMPSKIIKYYFEGYNEAYKNSDWRAFNVSEAESKYLKVPVGIYYKESWINPPQLHGSIMHENIHKMYNAMFAAPNVHCYIPWFGEGIADAITMMMIFKIFGKEELFKIKSHIEEIETLDPRKATYYYGLNITAKMLLMAGLPFVMALFKMHYNNLSNVDFNILANGVRNGIDPHRLISSIYMGADKSKFERDFLKFESEYSKGHKLDDEDIEVLHMFTAMQPPATLPTDEYLAALWLNEQVTKNATEHMVALEHDILKPVRDVPEDVRNRTPGFYEKVVILASAVPEKLRAGAEELGNKYFVVKREIAGKKVFDPWNGGLPWRFGCGELRCELKI